MSQLPVRAVPSRRVQSAALLLPLVGLFLLVPPVVTLFAGPVRLLGVPLILVYVFSVWGALTVAAALLARRLPATEIEWSTDAAAPADADPPPP